MPKPPTKPPEPEKQPPEQAALATLQLTYLKRIAENTEMIANAAAQSAAAQQLAVAHLEKIGYALVRTANSTSQLEWLEEISEHLACICEALEEPEAPEAIDFDLKQIKGGEMPDQPITGGPAGQPVSFRASLVPANAAPLQSGPTFSSDDPTVQVRQDDLVDPFVVTCTPSADHDETPYNLSVEGVSHKGNPINHTFVIPVSAAEAPEAVDFDLNQLPGEPRGATPQGTRGKIAASAGVGAGRGRR